MVKDGKLAPALLLMKPVIQIGDGANGGHGKINQRNQRTKGAKVDHHDEAAKQKKATTKGTLTWLTKSLQNVEDLLDVPQNCTPSLKRELMEDRGALATMASPKKCPKKSPRAKQDPMASILAKAAGSTSSCPKPRLKVKNVMPVASPGVDRWQCESSPSFLQRILAKWIRIGPIG
jgi:hypothetical protein